MAAIRVTSKNLSFMIALRSRFPGTQYARVPKLYWWWIRPRYEMYLPIDHRASLRDFQIRAEVARVAYFRGSPKYEMEVLDGSYSGKLTV